MEKKDFFVPENLVSAETEEHSSPSGKYSLTIERYITQEGGWSFTKGIIKEGDKILHEVFRNYSQFWHCWLENHPSGKPFILYGEDYQGYSTYNLVDNKEQVHLPEAAAKGGGWCFIEVAANPANDKIAVIGCVWAGPESIRLFDVSSLEILPLPLLEHEWYSLYPDTMKWEDNTNLFCILPTDLCKYCNKNYNDMSDEELDFSDRLEGAILEKFPEYPDYYACQSKVSLNTLTGEITKRGTVDNSNEEIDNFVKDFLSNEKTNDK